MKNTLIAWMAAALALASSCSTMPREEPPDAETLAEPRTPAPVVLPPAPPVALPAPPVAEPAQAQLAQAPPAASGQWVYTAQYGWIWMPYADRYVSVAEAPDAYPYQFVFFVSTGWTWVEAPWIWGWGVRPWFGPLGPRHFGWYRGPNHYYRGGGTFDVGHFVPRRR